MTDSVCIDAHVTIEFILLKVGVHRDMKSDGRQRAPSTRGRMEVGTGWVGVEKRTPLSIIRRITVIMSP